MRRPLRPAFAALALPLLLAAGAVVLRAAHAGAPEGAGLSELAFMTGCWEAVEEDPRGRRIVEHYTPPLANLMLGTTRYVSGDSAAGFELTTIRRQGAEVVLTPYPDGVASEHGFRMTHAAGNEARFEAPEHDFPKRIVYRLSEEGTLVARIDAGPDSKATAAEWTMGRVFCTGGRPE